jgi:hypothetical protein
MTEDVERPSPKAPALPASLPHDLRDFVECRSASVLILDGPQAWVTVPEGISGFLSRDSKPELTIEPGLIPGSARVKVSLGFISMTLSATIEDGRLSVDTKGLPMFAPASVATEIKAFVDTLNAWFKANGMGLGPPVFGIGQLRLDKVPVASGRPEN